MIQIETLTYPQATTENSWVCNGGAQSSRIDVENLKTVSSKHDFPEAVNGVISISGSWLITTEVDLEGDRIEFTGSGALLGTTPEVSILYSTGLNNDPLITSTYSIKLYGITFSTTSSSPILDLQASNSLYTVLVDAVNFVDCPLVGTINGYGNTIFNSTALLNSGNLIFDGVLDTVAFSNCYIATRQNTSAIVVPNTCTINRRFRIVYSAFVVQPVSTGLDVGVSASIPSEGYILDTVNFSGGGTFTDGIQYNNNKALFTDCVGINNSATVASAWVVDNMVPTNIASRNTPTKAVCNLSQDSVTQKFTVSGNDITYTGSRTSVFYCGMSATITSSSNQSIALYIAVNDVVIPNSKTRVLMPTGGGGAAKVNNIVTQAATELATGDRISVYIENESSPEDVTLENCTIIVRPM